MPKREYMSSSTSKNNHEETAKQQRLKYGALSIAAQHLAKNVSKFKTKNHAPRQNRAARSFHGVSSLVLYS